MLLLKTLSFSTLSILFVLIFIGGYVSASGVGLSCPDWPLCPAGLVPLEDFIIEYFHRTIAAITGLMVIITMVFTLKSKQAPTRDEDCFHYCRIRSNSSNYFGCYCNYRTSPCPSSNLTSWNRNNIILYDGFSYLIQ